MKIHASQLFASLSLALALPIHAARVPDMRIGAPSISAEAVWNDTLDFEDGTGGLDLSSFRFDAPIWGGKTGSDVYGLELKYDWTQFDLTPGFGEVDLHGIDLSARWAHFPKDAGWLGMLKVSGGVGTDFSDFNSDAWQASVLGFWGYQTSPKFAWAIAGFASYSLGEVTAYPSIGIVWTPNEQWRVQLTPPLAIVSYKPSDDWRFGLTFLPNGGSWQVQEQAGVEQIDLSLWTLSASIERRLADKLFVSLRGGVNVGGDIELRDGNEEVLLERDLDPGAFVAVGLSWEF